MATRCVRVMVLGQEIVTSPALQGVVIEETKDYVLWTYNPNDPIEMRRATFEVACEQLWQTVQRGMPPRSPN